MAGLAVPIASSDAWPEMGAQAERALNLGWVLDQRPDGIGGFTVNCSPTSSGLTFKSTGDATAFYVVGRTLRIIQADPRTTVCSVGQSSFAAGITTVYISQFSTAAGLSTVASTQAMTSVAAGPGYPSSTANNVYGGAVVFATTSQTRVGINTPNPVTEFVVGGGVNAGFEFVPAVGVNTVQIIDRNLAAYAVMQFDASIINFRPGGVGSSGWTISTGYLSYGSSAGSSGVLRLPASDKLIVGKTSTGGDDIIWPMQYSSTTLAANVQSSGQNFTTVITKTLPVGTWKIDAAITALTSASGVPMNIAARISDGTNVFASIGGWLSGSTQESIDLPVSAIVSHTTALAYNLQLASGSTAPYALALTVGSSSPGATYWTAVKIG